MDTPERSNPENSEPTWTYETRYDVVRWASFFDENEESNRRLHDIENFVNYVNNEMPNNYMALTRMTQNHNECAWLYTQNDKGEFEPAYQVWSMPQFMGDKIELHGDQVFLINSEHGVAAQPLENITMINTAENERKTRYIDIKIQSAIRLAKQRSKMARYSIVSDRFGR